MNRVISRLAAVDRYEMVLNHALLMAIINLGHSHCALGACGCIIGAYGMMLDTVKFIFKFNITCLFHSVCV